MTTGGNTKKRMSQPLPKAGEETGALGPYLSALRLVRAELLAQEIQGKRAPNAVDAEIDGLLDRYYSSGRGIPLATPCLETGWGH